MDESWPGGLEKLQKNCYCTFKVTWLLRTPAKLACTVICKPAEPAESVPVPLPFVSVRFVVSDTTQVTELVMSCCVPLNVPIAVKVTVLLC